MDAIWRIESPKLIAGLTRLVWDINLAEELAQDAIVAALEQWPKSGFPDKPGAWLMAVGKRRAIDMIRREQTLARKIQEMSRTQRAEPVEPAPTATDDDADMLRLIFTACHPVLSTQARVPLTLRLVGGLTTDEIARAFLIPSSTVAQRIVRAKRTLAERRIPFDVPEGPELARRLPSVLEVIYLIFNEGYAATDGDDWIRPSLCEDAQRLGRVLAELLPGEAEVHGLIALLELQASRLRARIRPDGTPIMLAEQDRGSWDQLLIRRGLAALSKATTLSDEPGQYTLQAQIAACHATSVIVGTTDWRRIAALYGELAERTASPVVELNRAVAVSMAFGPSAGLALVDALADEPSLRDYHPRASVRGAMLARLGRLTEARAEFERAAALTRNTRERALLLDRAAACLLWQRPTSG